ncbi:MAG: outer membrane beta-barrel protein [Spirosomataceae bacterium]
MKTLAFAFAAVMMSATVNAQDVTTHKDTAVAPKTYRWIAKNEANFEIGVGLDNWTGNKNQVGYADNAYDLRPGGSRYVSLGLIKYNALARGEKAALRLRYGLEVSWYNFMFEGNNVAVKGANRIEFPESTENLSKTKLTASYLTVPVGFRANFRYGFIKYIGAGGYAGLRLGSHSKTKVEETGKKDHVYNNFYLQDFRYGVSAEIGIRRFAELFFNYDLNNTFQDGKGPKVNAFSFGIKI